MTRAHNKSDLRCQLPHERILERNVAEEEEEEKKDIKTERMQFSLFSFSFFFLSRLFVSPPLERYENNVVNRRVA